MMSVFRSWTICSLSEQRKCTSQVIGRTNAKMPDGPMTTAKYNNVVQRRSSRCLMLLQRKDTHTLICCRTFCHPSVHALSVCLEDPSGTISSSNNSYCLISRSISNVPLHSSWPLLIQHLTRRAVLTIVCITRTQTL